MQVKDGPLGGARRAAPARGVFSTASTVSSAAHQCARAHALQGSNRRLSIPPPHHRQGMMMAGLGGDLFEQCLDPGRWAFQRLHCAAPRWATRPLIPFAAPVPGDGAPDDPTERAPQGVISGLARWCSRRSGGRASFFVGSSAWGRSGILGRARVSGPPPTTANTAAPRACASFRTPGRHAAASRPFFYLLSAFAREARG